MPSPSRRLAVAVEEVRAFLTGGGQTARSPAQAFAPRLESVSIEPSTVAPGDAFILHYRLAPQARQAVPAVLGASIRPGRTDPYRSDPPNDRLVDVEPGVHDYARAIRVPRDARPGLYEVLWGVFDDQKRERYYGLLQEDDLQVSGPRAAPPTWPEDAVRSFYALLGAGDTASAWSLLSAQYRAPADRTRSRRPRGATRNSDRGASRFASGAPD